MFRVSTVKRAGSGRFDLVVENEEGFQFLAHYQQGANRVDLGKRIQSGSYLIGNPEDTYENLHSVVRKAVDEYRANPEAPPP